MSKVPRFSPDGKSIAFSSNRAGNYDVYVILVEGGKPRQLTFNTADDYVVGWTPDGRKIIFSSSRNLGAFPGVSTPFEVSGRWRAWMQPVPTDWDSWASLLARWAKMAFTRHPEAFGRGSIIAAATTRRPLVDGCGRQKLFLSSRFPTTRGTHLWPMYGHDGWIYFVADCLPDEETRQSGADQKSCKAATTSGRSRAWRQRQLQVTHHADGNLFFPSMSADGKTIAYEENVGLWKLDSGPVVKRAKSPSTSAPTTRKAKSNCTPLRTTPKRSAFRRRISEQPSRRTARSSPSPPTRGEVQHVTETSWAREVAPLVARRPLDRVHLRSDGSRGALYRRRTGAATEKAELDADLRKSRPSSGASDSKSLLWSGLRP